MIIIVDRKQLTTRDSTDSSVMNPSLKHMQLGDFMGPGSRLDTRTVSYADLIVITDRDSKSCLVVKDRYDLFPKKHYHLLRLDDIIKAYNNIWLHNEDPNKVARDIEGWR